MRRPERPRSVRRRRGFGRSGADVRSDVALSHQGGSAAREVGCGGQDGKRLAQATDTTDARRGQRARGRRAWRRHGRARAVRRVAVRRFVRIRCPGPCIIASGAGSRRFHRFADRRPREGGAGRCARLLVGDGVGVLVTCAAALAQRIALALGTGISLGRAPVGRAVGVRGGVPARGLVRVGVRRRVVGDRGSRDRRFGGFAGFGLLRFRRFGLLRPFRLNPFRRVGLLGLDRLLGPGGLLLGELPSGLRRFSRPRARGH